MTKRERKINENRLRNLVCAHLPKKAQDEGGYPVQLDHCFARLAYDAAVGQCWRDVVEPPFYKNATNDILQAAVMHAEEMLREASHAEKLQAMSLRWRGKD